ncbi:MAG: MaoC/PaaZ C-terminal domain-containing protein, partial [Bdellovibrionia bacterium]
GDMMKFGKVFDFKRAREAAAKNPALFGAAPAATATATATAAAPAAGGTNGRIQKAFELMKVAFTADKAAGWTTVMQFNIEGADNYTVTVNNGQCDVQVGLQGAATCKITTTADTMAGMIEGKISGQQAFLGGKIKASNMGDMMKFGKVFDFKRARDAAAAGGGAQAAGTQATAAAPAAPAANVDFDGLFKALPKVFVAENAAGWNGKLVFDIGGTGGYTVDIASGKVDVKPGKETGAACVITGTGADFTGFLTGKTEWANYKGKLQVNNQIALIKVAKVFNWKTPDLAAFVRAAAPTDTGGGLNKTLIGKKYRAPYVLVKREKIIDYALATNDPNPMYKTSTADKDLVAPSVFPVTLVGDLFREMLQDDTGMDFSRMVHGEQRIQTFSNLRPGDIVSPRGTISNIETKSNGGEVMTFEQFLYRDGELAVQITTSLFVRAAKKSDAPKETVTEKPKDTAGKPIFTYQVKVAGDQPLRYAKASGDNNPIHTDLEIAKAAGFPNVILHGLCTMAFTSQAVIVNKLGGDITRLKDISVRFSKPVFPSDTLTIEAFEGRDGLSFVAVNNQGVPVITNGVAHFA